jgi:ketol-acid reductoisomerase
VVVGLRGDSGSAPEAEAAGLTIALVEEAVASADVAMMLAPDQIHAALYREIEPHLRQGAALGFSHGLSVRFGLVEPRADLDVFLIAPKGPGTALRSLYREGKGMIALWAIAQDSTSHARDIALAYGRAIGCARAGLIGSSFAEEAEADLFNEQAVVWGGVPELLIAGFETLVAGGISPEVAVLECVGELKLIAELIDERGIAGMREAISNTAEFGALKGGDRIVNADTRTEMRRILREVRSGAFVRDLLDDAKGGYPKLKASRANAATHPIEAVGARLRALTEKE